MWCVFRPFRALLFCLRFPGRCPFRAILWVGFSAVQEVGRFALFWGIVAAVCDRRYSGGVFCGELTLQNAFGDFGAGFAGEVTDDEDVTALGSDDGEFFGGELVDGVIATFDIDIGVGDLQEVCGAEVVEDINGVNGFECGDDGGAVGLGVDGAVGAFELGDGAIAVEAHDGGGKGAALGTEGTAPDG